MKLRPFWNLKSKQFTVRGIEDKVLTKEGIRYALFFDIDEKYLDEYQLCNTIGFPFRLFRTPNGYHAIGFGLHTIVEKLLWFSNWKKLFPNSDFLFTNGTLRPVSKEELVFTVSQLFSRPLLIEPIVVDYYRDKSVFENWRYLK